ncbi:hypothetical protein EVAR_17238_1 [Eumeta japonica]|uniref:Uncharacterized protein n=1 Tax=Eumeta variegata TaxID=151549 RepID=A0A4C1TSZ6_EUMVA|nr:hypothetical protein EVAR_17238_1 [Eumeta japonica]
MQISPLYYFSPPNQTTIDMSHRGHSEYRHTRTSEIQCRCTFNCASSLLRSDHDARMTTHGREYQDSKKTNSALRRLLIYHAAAAGRRRGVSGVARPTV